MTNYRGLSDAQSYAFQRLIWPSRWAPPIGPRTLAALERKGLAKQDADGKWIVPEAERLAFFRWSREQDRKRHGLNGGDCRYGYTEGQLDVILGDRRDAFSQWMWGQTMVLCDGRAYNHDTREYEPSCDGVAHGPVVYEHDLIRFLDGRPIVD